MTQTPAPEPVHDCDDEFSPYCVDACADPCQCGCNPGLTRAPHPAVRFLRYVLLRLILPASIGAAVGAFLTPAEAGIAAICLGGLWLIWAAARP